MKKIIIVIVGVIVLVLGISIGLNSNKDGEQGEIDIKNNVEETVNFNETLSEKESNKINEEIVNEEENNIANEVSSETFEEEPKTEQEKAINIVKTDWIGNGNIQNVKYIADGMDTNGRYIICVRDKDTTEALAFYTVNVQNKTFTKREMN